VLQCVLQCVALNRLLQLEYPALMIQVCVAVCRNVCCSVLQCVLQCVAMCVAVCRNVLDSLFIAKYPI